VLLTVRNTIPILQLTGVEDTYTLGNSLYLVVAQQVSIYYSATFIVNLQYQYWVKAFWAVIFSLCIIESMVASFYSKEDFSDPASLIFIIIFSPIGVYF